MPDIARCHSRTWYLSFLAGLEAPTAGAFLPVHQPNGVGRSRGARNAACAEQTGSAVGRQCAPRVLIRPLHPRSNAAVAYDPWRPDHLERVADDDPITIVAQASDPARVVTEAAPTHFGASIVILTGAQAGQSVPIESKTTLIGRNHECEVRLDVPDVSRRHASIIQNHYGEYELEDHTSRNGVTVNGHRVDRQPLRYGDRIGIGREAILLFTHYDQLGELLLQRQRMESIGALAGGVAHDFNNLLGAILANVNALMAESTPRPTLEDEILDDVRTATLRASELTNQLLAFARRGQYEQRPTSASKICQEALRLAQRTFGPRIELTSEVDPSMMVLGDPSQLHQVIMNLLINGRDAMPKGGTLTVTGRRIVGREIVGLEPGLSYAAIRVSDTGPGMDATTRKRVFEPFFTTKALGQGTGLGLATAYGIVKNHGGDIRVESQPGQGASFTVFLPLQLGSSGSSVSPSVEMSLSYRPQDVTVLVVDDDALFIRALERMLSQCGFRIHSAQSGEDALRVIQQRPYEIRVVLLDILMPQMSGEQVFEQIRAIVPELPIILISGYADSEAAHRMQEDGAAGFLRKPVTLEQLQRAIGRALRGDREMAVTPARAWDSETSV